MKSYKTRPDADAVAAVAKLCKCSRDYVRKVVTGERETKSNKAQMIEKTYNIYVMAKKKALQEAKRIPDAFNDFKKNQKKIISELINA